MIHITVLRYDVQRALVVKSPYHVVEIIVTELVKSFTDAQSRLEFAPDPGPLPNVVLHQSILRSVPLCRCLGRYGPCYFGT